MSVLLGASDGVFTEVNAAVPNCTDRRVYFDTADTWDTNWPLMDGTTSTVSIRPYPTNLTNGSLDGQLKSLIESAPNDCRLTAYHEASNLAAYNKAPWLKPDGSRIVTAQSMQAVHTYLNNFCNNPANNPNGVAYGVIMCCPPDQMAPWMVAGLDWYGLDIYDWPQFHFNNDITQPLDIGGALTQRFDQWYSVVQNVSGQQNPHMNICETNSDYESHRPKWFNAVAGLLTSFTNGHVMDTFWGGDHDGWDATDTATINALKALS